jgi:glycosyltransferase involved in cell wall biosynthesis
MAVSICMATYNGERFIRAQVASILCQLSSDDEIVVVDDCSTDSTVGVLNEFCDPRIKIYVNSRNESHVYSFSRSISLASNETILMSDQDDVWLKHRVGALVRHLSEPGVSLVATNFGYIDVDGNEIACEKSPLKASESRRHIRNIVGIFLGTRNYFGCAMAIGNALTDIVLPIPRFVESHDLWIALAGNVSRSIIHLEERTVMRRIHGSNVSVVKRRVCAMLWSRVVFAASIVVLLYRRLLVGRKP